MYVMLSIRMKGVRFLLSAKSTFSQIVYGIPSVSNCLDPTVGFKLLICKGNQQTMPADKEFSPFNDRVLAFS